MTAINKSNYSIMNVKEIIETAFGSLDDNVVNFKLVQTVLLLLANQLRILERRVQIDLPFDLVESSISSFKLSEVKIHAKKKKQMNKGVLKTKKKAVTSALNSANKTIEKYAMDKTSTSKTSAEKSSRDKSSTYESTKPESPRDVNSEVKTSPDKLTEDKTDQSIRGKHYLDKSTKHKTTLENSLKHKTSRDKPFSSKKDYRDDVNGKSSETSIETTRGRYNDERKLADNQNILEDLMEKAEKELRVIHQRADSHEQPAESPTPMASIDNLETQYEKLIVVERVPSGSKADKRKSKDGSKISIVTQEEFKELVEIVDELQKRLEPIGAANFPENAKLMAELRKTASLTDAMAALQLSARLEAAEKVLKHMIDIVTEVVSNTPGVELDERTKIIFGGRVKISKGEKEKTIEAPTTLSPLAFKQHPDTTVLKTTAATGETVSKKDDEGEVKGVRRDCITYKDLDQEIKNICDEMMKNLQTITSRNAANTDRAYKLAVTLESKIDSALEISPRMHDLENLVSTYAEKINALDTGLSSQMTNYQDQLTQMQLELEIGLETMAETLANTGDTAVITELNNNFLNLQMEFENIGYRQNELQSIQSALSSDRKSLWRQIEMLRDTKSDRDEVVDALRDKAGIGDLNGLVTLEQFNAVHDDFNKRIHAAYDKFNNQEIIWQKAIDDFLRELNEKADLAQVLSLKDEISKHLNVLKSRMQVIIDIVGEPKSASVSKKLFRDTSCLCCSTPATMDLKKPETIPALPMFPDGKKPIDVKEYDKVKSIGDGDSKKCYPGLLVPHPRSHYCQRYCGGSHTLLPSAPSKVPPSTVITPIQNETCRDDKVYKMDNQNETNLCSPCNMTLTTDEACKVYQRRS